MLGDDGDDLVIPRRAVPPFPWDSLRYIFALGGDYSSDTTAKAVPMSAHRIGDGIRYAALERAQFGPVLTAIQRAFGENRARHRLHDTHWRVLLAVEVGMVYRPDRRGIPRICIYRPERPDARVPDDEAARMFGLAVSTVRVYHSQARAAIEDEWRWLHAGYEG